MITSIEANGVGVNRILETTDSIGIELTQFVHPNIDIIEEILYTAKKDAGIDKDVKYEARIADLQAYSEFNDEYINNSKLIYERKADRSFNTSNTFSVRPFLASREEFFKLAIMAENNSEFIISDNFFFSSNIKK